MKTTMKSIEALIKGKEDAAFERGRQSVITAIRPVLNGKPSRAEATGAKSKARTAASVKAPRKNWWATATPKQKKARTRKMLAGRGLKPKSER